MNTRFAGLAGTAAVVTAVMLAFLPALNAGYVWDDNAVYANPVVLNAHGIYDIWFNPAANKFEHHYWPIIYTVFWAQYQLGIAGPFVQHFTNVLVHALNAVLILWFCRREKLPGALLVALLFALHPTKVESVAWVIEFKDVLSGFFYLLALWAGVEFTRTSRKRRAGYGVACGFCFLIALLTKSVAVTLPAALLLYWWWRKRRIRRGEYFLLGGLLLVALIVVGFDFWYVRQYGAREVSLPRNFQSLLIAGNYWFYLRQMVWPIHLSAIYPRNLQSVRPELAAPYVLLISAVAVHLILWLLRNKLGRGPFAAMLYFSLTLSPTLGFVWFGYMNHSLVADRFLYLPSLAFAITAGIALSRLWEKKRRRGVLLVRIVLTLSLVATLGTLTFTRSRVYYNARTLFEDVLRKNPSAVAAYFNLGDFESAYGNYTAAAIHYGRGVTAAPEYSAGRVKYAEALARVGQKDEAVRQCRIALRLKPDFTPALHLYTQLNEPASGDEGKT